MPKIYTKTGDKGTTATFHGRMGKHEQLAVAIGSVDELNSWIGVCREKIQNFNLVQKQLINIQTNLLNIGSSLAGSGIKINSYEITKLEKVIDNLTVELPKLTNFIYPVGEFQVARAVARRCEREVVALEIKDKNILKYLNRLSDVLFTMARWVNYKMGVKEEVWIGKM